MGESTKSDLSSMLFEEGVLEPEELVDAVALFRILKRIYGMKNQEKQINALNLWLTLARHLLDKTYIGPPREGRGP